MSISKSEEILMTTFSGVLSILPIFFYLAMMGLVLYLQVKLSNKDNKYLGLIWPLISFGIAGFMTLDYLNLMWLLITQEVWWINQKWYPLFYFYSLPTFQPLFCRASIIVNAVKRNWKKKSKKCGLKIYKKWRN